MSATWHEELWATVHHLGAPLVVLALHRQVDRSNLLFLVSTPPYSALTSKQHY
jgi:hypothetical protein